MKKTVLFIQGGGAGAHAADKLLAASLRSALGAGYVVQYPSMPNEEDPQYEAYKAQIARELASVDGKVILVAHSVGATVLLRYLTEETLDKPVIGIFFIAAPYWGAEEWFDAKRLQQNLASRLQKSPPIFFYHSRDDQVVPFAHLAM